MGGHEGCGAIKAACLPPEKIEQEPTGLRNALFHLKAGLDEERLAEVHDPRAHDREAVVTNVKSQLATLTRDETIMKKVHNKELLVVGAFYEISSGIVDFFLEITEAAQGAPAPKAKEEKGRIVRTKSFDKEADVDVRPSP